MEDIVVYYITGRQLGPLSVPDSWCEDCDLTIRTVQSALQAADPQGSLSFAAKPWLANAGSALRRGGWHPPVVLVEGKLFSQGVVPSRDLLSARLRDVRAARRPNAAEGNGGPSPKNGGLP